MIAGKPLHLPGFGEIALGLAYAPERAILDKGLGGFGDQCAAGLSEVAGDPACHAAADTVTEDHERIDPECVAHSRETALRFRPDEIGFDRAGMCVGLAEAEPVIGNDPPAGRLREHPRKIAPQRDAAE